jgi:hypothetical protein
MLKTECALYSTGEKIMFELFPKIKTKEGLGTYLIVERVIR